MDWTTVFRFPAGAGIFFLVTASRLILGAHPAFYAEDKGKGKVLVLN
jgi:hypothetical protein